jgi:hypothetical protein
VLIQRKFGELALKDALESLVPDLDPEDGWTYEPVIRAMSTHSVIVLVVASGCIYRLRADFAEHPWTCDCQLIPLADTASYRVEVVPTSTEDGTRTMSYQWDFDLKTDAAEVAADVKKKTERTGDGSKPRDGRAFATALAKAIAARGR